MKWSPQQDAALKAAAKWYKDSSQQVFRLFGYAGTGKTTLAKHLAEDVDGLVLFGAYTGKAALVLQQKGCPATTIHSMIYNPKTKSDSHLNFLRSQLVKLGEPKMPVEIARAKQLEERIEAEEKRLSTPSFSLAHESAVRGASLVIIDECSMVDERMGEDLLSFGKKVLVLGDPAQLPPVGGGGYFTESKPGSRFEGRPDVMLDEIHRQSAGSPVINLATRVRKGQPLQLGAYGDSRVIHVSDLNAEAAMAADQILVAKNATRRSTNLRMRRLLGHADSGKLVNEGERVICLRNDHELGLLNGAMWNVVEAAPAVGGTICLGLREAEKSPMLLVEAHTAPFVGEKLPSSWFERINAQEFDYGYAVTGHKAQGSQWPNVLVLNEGECFGAPDHRRWLYTCITRAAEAVTVVQF